MLTPSDAIDLLGGTRAVSDRLHKKYTTVASWASRQSIPASEWTQLIEFASEKGVENFTYEALAKAHAKQGEAA